ncbi:MAG TPA: hypothetical protein PKJ19_08090 [Flavobacteriales bacterium]|nr:hypothetical protein [Flavobacteriales bacterium]HNU57218.1 hypothetical protein [Flavobacteriales bacterium]
MARLVLLSRLVGIVAHVAQLLQAGHNSLAGAAISAGKISNGDTNGPQPSTKAGTNQT